MTALDYKNFYDSEEFKTEFIHIRDDFGASYTAGETIFRVFATFADNITVCLYQTGTDEEEGARIIEKRAMVQVDKGLWQCTIVGDLKNLYYTYQVERDGNVKECIDPYAKACGCNGKRGMIIDLKDTNIKGWEKDKEWKQTNLNTVIYELHVKDFSYDKTSGIKDDYQGKYKAFTQKKELKYLKSLGITHLHLLPVFDFASVDEDGSKAQFNWGYDPMNYNIPEGSYSTDSFHGDVRIREFKEMVKALHKAGIAVVMDMVYNHTYVTDSCFQTLAPYYYYRQNENGEFSDGSACGNETASEKVMCGQYILQSVLYWAKEYHIDGFRFDLMGLHDTQTMNMIRNELDKQIPEKDILLYGEPWVAGNSPMQAGFYPAVKSNLDKLDNRIAVFCDNTRDTIKGNVFDEKDQGFVNGRPNLEENIASVVIAWCNMEGGFPSHSPNQIINYVSAHDNYTLWDKLVHTMKTDENFADRDEQLVVANKLTAGIIFTCMGTPFFQAGEEFARTKKGDENSYQSPPEINCLDYSRKDSFSDLVDYYRGLIELRGQISFYRDKSTEAIKRIKFVRKDSGVVAFEIDNNYTGNEQWKTIMVAYNGGNKSIVWNAGDEDWDLLVDGTSSYLWKTKGFWKHHVGKYVGTGQNVTVKEKSIAILAKRV